MTGVEVVRRGPGWAVAFKPAGALIDADPAREPETFRQALAGLLAVPFRSCHPHTRIDRPVAGLTLWSLDAPTRRTFLDATRSGRLRKLYLALCTGADADARPAVPPPQARCPWRTRAGRPLSRPPETRLVRLAATPTITLWAVGITAGKWHQIRLHLAGLGCPLIGDRLHGGPPRVVRPDGAVLAAPAVALEAVGIEFPAGAAVEHVVEAPRSFLLHAASWGGLPAEAVAGTAMERTWAEVWSPVR